MEPADIRRHALAALQFNVEAEPAGPSFTLCVPTRLQMQLCLLEATGGTGQRFDAAARLRYRRLELLRAVTAWSGVCESHILGPRPGGDEPLPFDATLVEPLLDAQPAWEDALGAALIEKTAERAAAQDTAAKNS